jgi:hypothetical protein
VSAAFLPAKALVVSTDGRTDDARRKFVAAPEDYLRGRGEDILSKLPPQAKTVPMIVLVNGASASASEIVAGALQDTSARSCLARRRSAKGSVQTIIPLRVDGDSPAAIKLTTARYYTPKGRSIQARASSLTSSSKTHRKATSLDLMCAKQILSGTWKTPRSKTRPALRRFPAHRLRAARPHHRQRQSSRSTANQYHRSVTTGAHRGLPTAAGDQSSEG